MVAFCKDVLLVYCFFFFLWTDVKPACFIVLWKTKFIKFSKLLLSVVQLTGRFREQLWKKQVEFAVEKLKVMSGPVLQLHCIVGNWDCCIAFWSMSCCSRFQKWPSCRSSRSSFRSTGWCCEDSLRYFRVKSDAEKMQKHVWEGGKRETGFGNFPVVDQDETNPKSASYIKKSGWVRRAQQEFEVRETWWSTLPVWVVWFQCLCLYVRFCLWCGFIWVCESVTV